MGPRVERLLKERLLKELLKEMTQMTDDATVIPDNRACTDEMTADTFCHPELGWVAARASDPESRERCNADS